MKKTDFDEKWNDIKMRVCLIADRLINTRHDHKDTNDMKWWNRVREAHCAVTALCDENDLDMFPDMSDRLKHEDTADGLVALWYRGAKYSSAVDPAVDAEAYPRGRTLDLFRINAPAWFKNEKFVEWLNAPGTATWHTRRDPDSGPHDYSDVFFTFCQGDGSDYPGAPGKPGIPQEIWEHLELMIVDQFGWQNEVLVWVSNLE